MLKKMLGKKQDPPSDSSSEEDEEKDDKKSKKTSLSNIKAKFDSSPKDKSSVRK